MSRKICIVTGSRAEYGLLRFVMQGIREERLLELQVVATGTHLSPEFGLTYREIVDDGYDIARRVEMLLSSDTPTGLAKSMGLGLIGFADALAELKPDLLVLLGDRFEVFPAAAAALVARGGRPRKGRLTSRSDTPLPRCPTFTSWRRRAIVTAFYNSVRIRKMFSWSEGLVRIVSG